MRKVGIITLNGYKNYGNRLQNYALQEAIRSIGFKVETVIINQNDSPTKASNPSLKLIDITIIKRGARKILNIKNKKYNDIKTENFKKFSKKYITETSYKISDENLPITTLSHYDTFVVGSDQVWNPFYINGSPLYFLNFVPSTKRVSYAASFGISIIPDEYKTSYKKYLTEMKCISVREEQGASIVKEITGRDAQVLLDPTMLLSKDNWRSIAKESNEKPNSPYLLTYFLGDISKNTKRRINEIAKEKNLKIVNLASLKDIKYYTADPSEFINYIDSAEVFCTDSFHGVVFSILLETPFIVFERQGKLPSMNSRIETLLTKFNFKSRLAKNISRNDEIYNIDYSQVDKILRKEREQAYIYLKEALK